MGSGKRVTHIEYVNRLRQVNPNVQIVQEYAGMRTPVLHYCVKHDYTWNLAPTNALKGGGCKYCRSDILKQKFIKSQDEYLKDLKKTHPEIECIELYQGANKKIKHKCKECGYIWSVIPSSLINNNTGCPMCGLEKNTKDRTRTHKEYVELVKDRFDVLEEYIDSQTPILHKCKKCGEERLLYPNNVIKGHGCQSCAAKIHGINKTKTTEQFTQEIEEIYHGDMLVLGEYISGTTPIKMQCNKCGYIWDYSKPCTFLTRHISCPSCGKNVYQGEKEIEQVLLKFDIFYTRKKTFDDLKGVGGFALSYDFYLPTYNLLIEYQGIQHEQPVEHFGGEEQFKVQQEHDRRKREYAKEYGIKLLEIWYYDFDNIEQIIFNEFLNV